MKIKLNGIKIFDLEIDLEIDWLKIWENFILNFWNNLAWKRTLESLAVQALNLRDEGIWTEHKTLKNSMKTYVN